MLSPHFIFWSLQFYSCVFCKSIQLSLPIVVDFLQTFLTCMNQGFRSLLYTIALCLMNINQTANFIRQIMYEGMAHSKFVQYKNPTTPSHMHTIHNYTRNNRIRFDLSTSTCVCAHYCVFRNSLMALPYLYNFQQKNVKGSRSPPLLHTHTHNNIIKQFPNKMETCYMQIYAILQFSPIQNRYGQIIQKRRLKNINNNNKAKKTQFQVKPNNSTMKKPKNCMATTIRKKSNINLGFYACITSPNGFIYEGASHTTTPVRIS